MAVLKTVGRSGQITLGKEYAGCQIVVDQLETGVWLIKTGSFIPDNERWLHSNEVSQKLRKAIDWAEHNEAKECNLAEFDSSISAINSEKIECDG